MSILRVLFAGSVAKAAPEFGVKKVIMTTLRFFRSATQRDKHDETVSGGCAVVYVFLRGGSWDERIAQAMGKVAVENMMTS